MYRFIFLGLGASLSLFYTGARAALDGHCPPLGPVLPAPTDPSSNPAVQSAVAKAITVLDGITAGLNFSALAVGVKSIHEDKLLLEYHYTPPNVDPRGVRKVDSDTVFRLASASKVFPVLAFLQLKGVDLNDPVTKYLPQLRDLNKEAREQTPIWTVDWDDITLGALASHLGGIGGDMVTDLQPYGNWTQLGFPPDDPSKDLGCSGLLGLPPCNDSVFWDRFGERPPVYLPFSPSVVYSNMGWAVLGFVFKNITGEDIGEYIQKNIWEPQGMSHTFPSKPDDKLGFIPVNDQWWNASIGFEAPAGNYYSSINDLHKFGDAVLLNKVLSPAKTRKWLKPVTGTSSAGTFIGTPWEIYRAHNITKDGRLIEFYTKGGDLITYHSFIVLIPDYDLVITALTAGPDTGGLATLAWSDVVTTLLPSIEQASKDDAQPVYAGTYSDEATNSTITLSLDDAPGFSVDNWIIRGVNIIDTYQSINLPPTFPTPPGEVRFRLYPTDIKTDKQESWRTVAATGTPEEINDEANLFFWPDAACLTWASMDRLVYELLSNDHFVFTVSNDGEHKVATKLEAVGYRVTLKKDS